MKKILFVNKSFEIGGIQSSLDNLLNAMSKDESFELDLLVFNPLGIYRDSVPENINIIKPSIFIRAMFMTFKQAVDTRNVLIIIYKLLATVWAKLFGNEIPLRIAFMFQGRLKGYDYAFAYHHEVRRDTTVDGFARFLIKRCDAKHKMVWIHTDIVSSGLNTKQNRSTYSKLDKIVAVSYGVRKSFVKAFPEMSDKTVVVHNFQKFNRIIEMSADETAEYKNDAVNFLTVSRISQEKGHMRAVNIFERLKREGYNFYWHLVGGADTFWEDNIRQAITKKGLTDNIIMHGAQLNPYSFFVNADCLLVPSYNEGAPIVFSEARCLKLPVITTKTSSAEEFISEKNVGIVCENTDEALFDTIKYVLDNPEVLNEYKNILNSMPLVDESKKEFLELLNKEQKYE